MTENTPVLLVAVDGSDCSKRALSEAAHFAKLMGAKLRVAHVVDWSDYSFINAIEIEERAKMRKQEETHAQEDILAPALEYLSGEGVEAEAELHFGHPPRTFVKMADDIDAKMVIAGTRGRSDVKSLVLGSFGHGLMQLSKRPVLLVP